MKTEFKIVVADPELLNALKELIEYLGEEWASDPIVLIGKEAIEKATKARSENEQNAGEQAYTLLVDKIYSTLITNPDMGLGEMGGVRDEAERIVKEWMEESGVKLLD